MVKRGSPKKPKLSPEAFVIQGIRALRYTSTDSSNNSHRSVHLKRLEGAFRKYFGKDIGPTINKMIEDKQLEVVIVKWMRTGDRTSRVDSAEFLDSYPDPQVADADPVLYIAGEVPRLLRSALNRSARSTLEKILAYKDGA
jgi:hypothetical protein